MKLVILFLFSLQCFAYSYFYFDKSKVSIDERTYRKYIVPQLKSITVEFYHILSKMNENNLKVVNVKNRITELNSDWQKWRKSCFRPGPDCNIELPKFYDRIKESDQNISSLLKKGQALDLEDYTKFDVYLNYLKQLDLVANNSFNIVHKFEQVLIHTDETYLPYPDIINEISTDLHNLKIETEILLFTIFEKNEADNFYFVWNSFIKKIESYILHENDPNVLIELLEYMNMSWNTFHMELVKGDLKIPKKLNVTFQVMHNRWNSILKIILKSK
ncbi:MAG: hypothetical protein H6622_07350 [Halobacteriovoraceae bacterium]|nr:hypothetical protein [Halobacteriovoraceae bacterium]